MSDAGLAVVALGGNALWRRGEPLDVARQRERLRTAGRALAAIAATRPLVVTHGNGPQVGLLALQSEACRELPPTPLDILGAESEGMIGYLVEQELANALPGRDVATLLTQVEVDPDDPAFRTPSKPIGPLYEETRARELAASRGFAIARDGDGFRRVVPSPAPRRVLELRAIALLVEHGVIVVCSGGGGIPVVPTPLGVRGVEAVVDKDRSAALLASALGATHLLLLTDVPAVYADWPARTRPLRDVAPIDVDPAAFEAGSMRPKLEAACAFALASGGVAHIGALEDAALLIEDRAGTAVHAGTSAAPDVDPTGSR
ncbi:MAG TPA: carbamate kinase [Myxococcota bacterium]|nr:carbamate kinase [Myxococcota bacterium]